MAAIIDGSRDVLLGARRGARPRVTACRDRLLDERLLDPAIAEPYPRIADAADLASVPAPAVLVSFHMGALMATGAFLEQLPDDVLVVRQRGSGRASRLTRLELAGTDEFERARLMRRAVAALRGGGYVFLTIDGKAPSYVGMSVFGRITMVASGAFALARLGRAPMVPLAVCWRGRGVEVDAGPPIPFGEPAPMAAALARWYEGYVTRHPREVRWPLLTLSGRLGLDRAVLQ